MIQFADKSTQHQVWDMWKSVFGDSDDYMNIYFRDKYKNENTLLYMVGDKAVASLQMLSYDFTFHGVEIPIIYLSGLCTLPEFRGNGYMKMLILRSYEVASERGVPLMVLVPQESWLLNFYDKYGFAQTFDESAKELPSLKNILEINKGNIEASYKDFDSHFRNQDMTVQKTLSDFMSIEEEAALFSYPAKKNLRGMTRVVDAKKLLLIYALSNQEHEFSLNVEDEFIVENRVQFTIKNGEVLENYFSEKGSESNSVDIRVLTQLLLGYHTSKMKAPLSTYFPEKTPQMHFMME